MIHQPYHFGIFVTLKALFEIILDISLPGLQQHDGGVSQVGKPLLLGRVGLVALPEHLAAAAPLLEPRQSRAESEDE